MTVAQFKQKLFTDYQRQVTNYFQGDNLKAMKFMSAVVYSVQKNPKLLTECDRDSLMTAFMACAEYELYPSNVSGEAYVIPYKGKAQFQLGYQGMITLLYRVGIESIQTNIVHKNDTFEYEEGLDPKLIHKPDVFGDRGEPIGVYAVAIVNGRKQIKVLGSKDILKFREFSQAKDSQYSPWNSKNDPELWMWRKTCIKQLAKVLPKTETIQKAIAADNEESTIAATKNLLNAEGPATLPAIHEPIKSLGPTGAIPSPTGSISEEPKPEEEQVEEEIINYDNEGK